MALDNFNFKIDKLDILPEHVVESRVAFYGEAANVIYGIYGTASGTKNGITETQVVSCTLPFVPGEFTPFNELSEETVVGWLESRLGEEVVNRLKVDIEQKIDMTLPAPTVNLPWNN